MFQSMQQVLNINLYMIRKELCLQPKGGPSTANTTDVASTATTAEITGESAIGNQQ